MKTYDALGKEQELRFDPRWYVTTYPDCLATSYSPSEHYLKVGKLLGRSPAPAQSAAAVVRRPGGPKVSVLCITYNHERYIESTLEGFCRQKTDFDVEFIVADDCSTDRTASIIQRYAKLDPRIVPVLHKANLGVAGNFRSAVAAARGEYVALCEGDDYWTDPTKLQRQADQLDQDPDLSIVFHPVEVFNDADGKFEYLYPPQKPELTFWELVYENFIQTNSVMYRWRFYDGLPYWFDTTILPLDWYIHLCHAELGKIGYLPRVMAKYRKHNGGIWSSAATDPRELRRRYGKQQLRFFLAASTVAGGLFADHIVKTFDDLLQDIFLDALACNNAELICDLATEHEVALVRLGLIASAGAKLPGSEESNSRLARIKAATRISVVVLTYNHDRYIEQCLYSVLQQRGPFELEVIIGDDFSSDDTLAKIEAIAACHPNVKVLTSEANVGMLENMKRCLAACTGDFIAFCEGDDYWLGDRKLIRQAAQLKRDRRLAMSFNWVLLEHELDGQIVPHPQQAAQPELIPTATIASNPLTANFSCCMYRAEAARSVPDIYFAEKGNADWMFNMHVAEWGGIAFLRELHSVYRLHSKGQWTGLTKKVQDELFENARKRCSQLLGPARGFDDHRVSCFVEPMPANTLDRFVFHFDSPHHGAPGKLESGRIRVTGWIVDKLGKRVKMRLGDDIDAIATDTDVSRINVSQALSKSEGCYHSPLCGFDLRPRFDLANNQFKIFALIEDKEFHIATIKALLSP